MDIKQLIKDSGICKEHIAKRIKVFKEYISHAINPKSPRYKTPKMEEIRAKIIAYLKTTKT